MLRNKCIQTTLKTLEILKNFEKADGFYLLLAPFLCEVIKEEFRLKELLFPGMRLKPVLSYLCSYLQEVT